MPVNNGGPVVVHVSNTPVVVHVNPRPTIHINSTPGVGIQGPAGASGAAGTPGATGPAGHSFLPLSFPGTLAVSVGDIPVTATRDTVIFGVWASAGDEPIGADAIFDLRIDGVSIFTTPANRPTIPDGANTDTGLAVPDTAAWLAGQQLTGDVVQVGSTQPGARVTLMVDCQ